MNDLGPRTDSLKGAVTVIIPFFNQSTDNLQRAVSSVIQLPFIKEVILVDDYSDSITSPKSLALNELTPPVRVVHNDGLKGAVSSRLRGLQVATTEYVCFCDSDDELLPEGWNATLNLLSSSTPPDLIYGDFFYENKLIRTPRLQGHVYAYILKHLSLYPFSGLTVKRLSVPIAEVSQILPAWQDDDFILAVARRGSVQHTNQPNARLRRTPGSISSSTCRLADGLGLLLQKYGSEIVQHHGQLQRLAWTARHVDLRSQCLIEGLCRGTQSGSKSFVKSVFLVGLTGVQRGLRFLLRKLYRRLFDYMYV